MSEPEFSTAALDRESEETFTSLRRRLGAESLGISQLLLHPGQRMRVHKHKRQEEIYIVVAGTLTLIVEGEEHQIPTGHLARVGPHTPRQLGNRGSEPVLLVALGAAGDEHVSRDGIAWGTWDEGGEGREPKDVPLPPDFED